MKEIIQNAIQNSFSYAEYRKLASDLVAQGKPTGHDLSEALAHYAELNETRMNRLEKTITLTDAVIQTLQNSSKNVIWLVLAESWCGDAAQILPVLNKMSEASNTIQLNIVLRDDHDALMQLFLTNGAKSIPKLIILDAQTLNVVADWGPRPLGAKQLIEEYKATHGVVDETGKIELQKWYLHDKGISIQQEILEIMRQF
ncbi:MAG: thioredoxin family protein [Flavobacterium sp.]|nr:thioredoxin family protein [Flavobacterium sp.]MBP6073393.1 thioredoxin family protein [Flavobacterium sp.]